MKFEIIDLIKDYSKYLGKRENLLKLHNEERLKMEAKQSKEKKELEECQKLQIEKLEKENYGIINLFLQYFPEEKDRNPQENEANIIPLNEGQNNQNDGKKKEENKKDRTQIEENFFDSQNSKKRFRDGGNDQK